MNRFDTVVIGSEPELAEALGVHTEDISIFLAVSEAIDFVKKNKPTYIFVSLVLDSHDGVDVCREIRNELPYGFSHIILLSPDRDSFLEIHALQNGADEFWSAPFTKRLIRTKLSALFRRKPKSEEDIFDEKSIKTESRGNKIEIGDSSLELPRKEFEILHLLKNNPKKVFSRAEIISYIWGKNVNVNGRTIDVHIKSLRTKLGSDKIQTIKGVGYKLDI
ncbi:MAG: winged helix-turn-helix domain-containing protein [Flavobacteriales bacterium]